MIIQILGMPGSGKSYIGKQLQESKLKNTIIIDTDELLTDAFNELIPLAHFREMIKKNDWKLFNKTVINKRNHIVKNHIGYNFIYVGITVKPHKKTCRKYLIDGFDLNTQYRRYIKRELDKIYKSYKSISHIIRIDPDPELICEIITTKFQLVEKFPPKFTEFLRIYLLYKEQFSNKKCIKYKTTEQIIKIIKNKLKD
jgi:adenylate kinase family enzyme